LEFGSGRGEKSRESLCYAWPSDGSSAPGWLTVWLRAGKCSGARHLAAPSAITALNADPGSTCGIKLIKGLRKDTLFALVGAHLVFEGIDVLKNII
jgi:hypothetical protein